MHAIRRWALSTFILAFLVIIAGGVVRTTQSGMGCPDWPRCFGQWIPPTEASQLPPDFEKYLRKQDIDHSFNAFHTWIEYINRLLGALLGLFAVIQALSLFFKRQFNARAFRLSGGFLLLVILTGLFGALVVKYNLAHLSISVHLFFAVLILQVQLALLLELYKRRAIIPASPAMRFSILVFAGLLLFQSVMGTVVRIEVDEVSKALNYLKRDTWLSGNSWIFILHRSFSWLLLAALIALWRRSGKRGPLARQLYILSGLVLLNMTIGIILMYAGMPAFAQPLHLTLACAAITQTMSILLQINTLRNHSVNEAPAQ